MAKPTAVTLNQLIFSASNGIGLFNSEHWQYIHFKHAFIAQCGPDALVASEITKVIYLRESMIKIKPTIYLFFPIQFVPNFGDYLNKSLSFLL